MGDFIDIVKYKGDIVIYSKVKGWGVVVDHNSLVDDLNTNTLTQCNNKIERQGTMIIFPCIKLYK